MIRAPVIRNEKISLSPSVRESLFTFITMALLLILPAGCREKKTEAPAVQAPPARPVEIVAPTEGCIRPGIDFTGTIIAVSEVDILSKIPGRVENVLVKEGDSVREGHLLIQLEDREHAALVRQVEANLESARTQLSRAQTAYGLQDIQVDVGISQSEQGKTQAELSSEQAKYNMEKAKVDCDRMQRLYQKGAISKDQLEGAELRYNVAQKQHELSMNAIRQSDESIKLARANIAMRLIKKDDITSAQSQIESLQASLDLAKVNLDNCRIVAPISGVITLKKVEKGQIVSTMPSGEPLLRIVDNRAVDLECDIGEEKYQRIKAGDSVELTVDAIPDKTFKGAIATIIPAADLKSKAFRVKVSVPNQSGELKSGMFGRASVLLPPVEGILIPRSCLIKSEGEESEKIVEDKGQPAKGPVVKKIKEQFFVFTETGGKAKKVKVIVGALNEKEAVIVEGVTSKTKVISRGQEMLEDNDSITVKSGKARI